ncbi:uncharacterized protein LOC125046845 isoform X2 [Penaeus chinensis]|uniref:uncharacterized protein LOC125046845 isoform X2 n=1 Tax=Penaeus chinensis TaxID=139456 RepID=UPI001FB726FF|nr:uncharacterized protein LOC125046845 isoform X2 [Penaeus chinensis]
MLHRFPYRPPIMKVKTALLSVVVASMVFEAVAAGMLDVDSTKIDHFLASDKWPRAAVCLAGIVPKEHPKYSKCLRISQYLQDSLKNGCQGCSRRENANLNKLMNAMKSSAPGMHARIVA